MNWHEGCDPLFEFRFTPACPIVRACRATVGPGGSDLGRHEVVSVRRLTLP